MKLTALLHSPSTQCSSETDEVTDTQVSCTAQPSTEGDQREVGKLVESGSTAAFQRPRAKSQLLPGMLAGEQRPYSPTSASQKTRATDPATESLPVVERQTVLPPMQFAVAPTLPMHPYRQQESLILPRPEAYSVTEPYLYHQSPVEPQRHSRVYASPHWVYKSQEFAAPASAAYVPTPLVSYAPAQYPYFNGGHPGFPPPRSASGGWLPQSASPVVPSAAHVTASDRRHSESSSSSSQKSGSLAKKSRGTKESEVSESAGGSGKYACEYCKKRFSRPSSLKIHVHSHTGERPFDCHLSDSCGRSFSVQSNLKRHMKIHDPGRSVSTARDRSQAPQPPQNSSLSDGTLLHAQQPAPPGLYSYSLAHPFPSESQPTHLSTTPLPGEGALSRSIAYPTHPSFAPQSLEEARRAYASQEIPPLPLPLATTQSTLEAARPSA